MRTAEQILLFDVFFIFLLGIYGGTAGGQGSLNLNSLTTIPAPSGPTAVPSFSGAQICIPYTSICLSNTALSLIQATATIGWALANIGGIILYLVTVMITFSDLALGVVFDPRLSANGIPFLGFFFTILQLIALAEIIRIFRGSSSGL